MLLTFLPDEQTAEPAPAAGQDDEELPPPSQLEWAYLYRRFDNKPFSLEYDPKRRRSFIPLIQIYNDPHPNIVVKKPSQKGLSTLAVTRSCHMLDVGAKYFDTDKEGLNVGYLFSTSKALSSFSKQRFSNLIAESEHLRDLFTEYDSVFFKKAGPSSMHLAGGKSIPDMLSFDADLLVLDEFDRIQPNIVALAEARLANSDLEYKFTLSTPTYPNMGIDALYLESDQKVWEVECGSCKEWNELDFFRDARADGEGYEVWKKWDKEQVAAAKMYVACPSCQQPIDTFGPGRWTARHPENKIYSGYDVPALSCGKLNLNKLAVMAVSTDPEVIAELHRSFLGRAYTPKDSGITDEMLKQLSVEIPPGLMDTGPWRDTTMGVDGGARYYYRITSVGPDNVVYVRKMGFLVPEPGRSINQQLAELMTTYRVRQAVVDGAYDPTAIKEFANAHKGRVRRAFYPNTDFNGELFRLPAKEEKKMHGVEVKEVDPQKVEDIINVNRTMAMDAVFNQIAMAKERWPSPIHNDAEISAQMKAPIRVIVKNKEGKDLPKWVHSKPDDYFHACVYDHIARVTLPRSTYTGTLPWTGDDD
jgi:hypothetical protein